MCCHQVQRGLLSFSPLETLLNRLSSWGVTTSTWQCDVTRQRRPQGLVFLSNPYFQRPTQKMVEICLGSASEHCHGQAGSRCSGARAAQQTMWAQSDWRHSKGEGVQRQQRSLNYQGELGGGRVSQVFLGLQLAEGSQTPGFGSTNTNFSHEFQQVDQGLPSSPDQKSHSSLKNMTPHLP